MVTLTGAGSIVNCILACSYDHVIVKMSAAKVSLTLCGPCAIFRSSPVDETNHCGYPICGCDRQQSGAFNLPQTG